MGHGAKVPIAAGTATHGAPGPTAPPPLALAQGGQGFQAQFAIGKSVFTVPDVLSCPSRVWKQAPGDALCDLASAREESDSSIVLQIPFALLKDGPSSAVTDLPKHHSFP